MKQDIREQITISIIESLETVSLDDYQAPFARLSAQKSPVNPVTNKAYRGINTLMLWLAQYSNDYQSNEWATFKQWKDKGASVRKGEKSTHIVFYKLVEKKDTDGLADAENFYHMIKGFCVFNADQVDGYEAPTGMESGNLGVVEKLETIETFIQKTKAKIELEGEKACYRPGTDMIEMPRKETFFDTDQTATENYYAVLLHELTHWTGGKLRLDRGLDTQTGKIAYAKEELIAELGSAFLCAQFGIMQQGRNDHAIYIISWLQALKNDTKYVFSAAAQAQKAVDLLNTLNGATPA